jgi:hypothetical protein
MRLVNVKLKLPKMTTLLTQHDLPFCVCFAWVGHKSKKKRFVLTAKRNFC